MPTIGHQLKLKLYNTLTRTKEAFTPIDPDNVRMYVCGPTVYDYAHIGNARPVIVFDVLFRLLRHLAEQGVWDGGKGETKVTYVRNITDVDDKINARAARDYPDLPLNDAIRKVTEKTANQFHQDVAALGCLEPTVEPRATEHIGDMIAITEKLVAGDHAYQANGEVLFSVSSMPDYGELSGRNLEDNIAGARVAVEEHKRNPADFVLWKQSSAQEPGWESPWGRGRPGWHLECSAMSEHYLGTTFDIHGGGLDLIFPHHENEIAQSRCAHGTEVMANYWMHNGYLQLEGRKMSKSEGNFVTISDLLATEAFGGRKWPGEVLRLAMLMTHYREPIDFTVARLEEAERLLRRWARIEDALSRENLIVVNNLKSNSEPQADVLNFLLDDLNSSAAITTMQTLARAAEGGHEPAKHRVVSTAAFLGINLSEMVGDLHVPEIEAALVKQEIQSRLAALAAKDFATADKIRSDLLDQGIQLMDYKDPETGEKRTKWEVRR